MLSSRVLSRTTRKSCALVCNRNGLAQYSSTPTPKPKNPTSTSAALPQNPSMPALGIFHLVRGASRPVRYTVFGALGVLATVECMFWIKVIQHKFFSPDQEASDDFSKDLGERVMRFRKSWIAAYGKYHRETIWGI
ncbi:hypothetical protein K504DRAFT_530517 [Pleomassaria siparia CBS 279.74]|uniref:Uncharacterized protein n=1 Tax=Pleomassaria siparia CBS 279.74 TaxID=1314801 RepID=A0A6G1KLP7_9PLEO|nr:hypothetical protein K504DRAFT_530517 [Pleomassaria siparia CBS 279.74]